MALSTTNFEAIKTFVLERGDRQTYCNMLNNNPHFAFSDFEVFLHPEGGQANINCDPALSDFDQIVIRDEGNDDVYIRVALQGGQLVFDAAHDEALTRYFARMLTAIDAGR